MNEDWLRGLLHGRMRLAGDSLREAGIGNRGIMTQCVICARMVYLLRSGPCPLSRTLVGDCQRAGGR